MLIVEVVLAHNQKLIIVTETCIKCWYETIHNTKKKHLVVSVLCQFIFKSSSDLKNNLSFSLNLNMQLQFISS